jgi:hypothetical protein
VALEQKRLARYLSIGKLKRLLSFEGAALRSQP